MKLTKCKRCDSESVYWVQGITGKWSLVESSTHLQHYCDDGKLKAVKCKYCAADDLHWAEDVDPITKKKKMVLSESYGLPHACDERLAFIAKEKQDKKDKYEAEKKRVAEYPEGKCSECKGTGYASHNTVLTPFGVCPNCHGQGCFNSRSRKDMLALVRQRIWPNMKSYNRGW